MADVQQETNRSRGLTAILLFIVLATALAIWILSRDRRQNGMGSARPVINSTSPVTLADSAPLPLTSPGAKAPGAGLGESPAAVASDNLFSGRDIHEVPLGTILDYAQKLTYDASRGYMKRLAPDSAGHSPTVKIWPEAGASSLAASMLNGGRIVARIESSGSYTDLGLAGGLNYLWVEAAPGGGYRGVVIPATAFAPLHDLDEVVVSEKTPAGVPLEKAAYWISRDGGDVPWIACGRCE